MSLNELTIAEARDRLRAREITAAELTDACLAAIEGAGALNAFVHVTAEVARERAALADAIEKSESMEEIRRLEEQLKLGYVPGADAPVE